MKKFINVQEILDRILGEGPAPNHGSFWRGVSRDQFVNLSVYGLPIIVIGDPEASNLIKALRGVAPFGADLNPPPAGAMIGRMPLGRPPAAEKDIVALEEWIREGCPESPKFLSASRTFAATAAFSDDVHVRYWRAVDDFFLPGLATPEAAAHVGRMHMAAYRKWLQYALNNQPLTVWTDYLAIPANRESFEFVRTHQRRLLSDFYEGSQDAYFDSIWKFGANLLPEDPLSHALPQHTMNGILDWFFWTAHLDATLRASDVSELDLVIARGWQLGIVADGLLRTDEERPVRIPIGDFSAGDLDLQQKVYQTFVGADTAALLDKMLSRAKDARNILLR